MIQKNLFFYFNCVAFAGGERVKIVAAFIENQSIG
jgi:hypothetical protein